MGNHTITRVLDRLAGKKVRNKTRLTNEKAWCHGTRQVASKPHSVHIGVEQRRERKTKKRYRITSLDKTQTALEHFCSRFEGSSLLLVNSETSAANAVD